VLLFFAAIVTALGYLHVEDIQREKEAVQHNVEYTQQRLRLRLLEREQQLMRLGREFTDQVITLAEFENRAQSMMQQYPEITSIALLNNKNKIQTELGIGISKRALDNLRGIENPAGESDAWLNSVNVSLRPGYTLLLDTRGKSAILQMRLPLNSNPQSPAAVLADYSIEGLLRHGVPPEVSANYAVSLEDAQGTQWAGVRIKRRPASNDWLPWLRPANEYSIPVSPVGGALILRGQAYRATPGVINNGLFWLVGALSLLTAWMLIANWRHSKRRLETQQTLINETNFRRAMENSMLTGMRAMDLDGRITYVNKAFCEMTGWTEQELVGLTAPFPYWPDEDKDFLMLQWEQELAGQSVASGLQVRVKRRDNSLMDARLYTSALVDTLGTQTGWVTSMTDITEPNRVREQLSASHQRFTTVLEALDASISVAPIGNEEVLFTNKTYRQWFGTDTSGHRRLVAQAGEGQHPSIDELRDNVDSYAGLPTSVLPDTDSESIEIFFPELDQWLEVRTRYLSWVDGRLAQIVIATDITSRRQAEEQAAAQAERAQNASRLITMGEMASSVAHELNQPLTAINNYCKGMLSRIKSQNISEADLLQALEKTAHQAQRAGQIIQRIRAFVKRSKPNRTLSAVNTIVAEAIELADIELRRFNVRLNHYVAERMPNIMVDPILIEQVLINLLRNAAESIDAALRLTPQRIIELRVSPRQIEGKAVIEFSVQDTGVGISPEVMERLYEAFYSTKPDGMGIGLSLCRSIVESHFGRMQAENLYNGEQITGCRFSFWIPLSTDEHAIN
jgi:PAS domain S-box-containing protein